VHFSARESADHHFSALHFGGRDLFLPFRQLFEKPVAAISQAHQYGQP
jgi:hypothetical protein